MAKAMSRAPCLTMTRLRMATRPATTTTTRRTRAMHSVQPTTLLSPCLCLNGVQRMLNAMPKHTIRHLRRVRPKRRRCRRPSTDHERRGSKAFRPRSTTRATATARARCRATSTIHTKSAPTATGGSSWTRRRKKRTASIWRTSSTDSSTLRARRWDCRMRSTRRSWTSERSGGVRAHHLRSLCSGTHAAGRVYLVAARVSAQYAAGLVRYGAGRNGE